MRKTVLLLPVFLCLLLTGCMGTFQTARVVPFRVGGYCFALTDDVDGTTLAPGVQLEGGWPAGAGRFGVGLHLKLMGDISGDNTGFLVIWGGKLQFPENHLVDIALGTTIWGYYPGEVKLFLSRELGLFEPYACVGAANFLFTDDDINLLGEGVFTFTGGTMIRLGSGSGWLAAAEFEGGSAWESTGFGVSLLKEF